MSGSNSYAITGGQLFCIVFCSRLAALMACTEISVRSIGAELMLFALLAVSAYLMSRSERLCSGALFRKTALILCAVLSAASVFTSADFRSRAISTTLPVWLWVVIISAAVTVAALHGTAALARFSPLCMMFVTAALLLGVISNIRAVKPENIFTLQEGGINALSLVKCADAPLLFLLLQNSMKERAAKPFFAACAASYAAAAAVFIVCLLVTGSAVNAFPYPVFTLFRLGALGSYNKLDILYSFSQLSALFLKTSVLLSFWRLK